jgi:ABC-2 type transport system ATP-binding protein
MRRRAGLAAALVHSPQLVVLDEPTAGQDPILRRTLWTGLGDLSREGTTMVVTTQHVAEAAYCDLVALLSEGELIALGGPDELRREAFGGDLVDVDFESTPGWADIQKMAGAIEATTTTALGPRSVRYTVEDASVAIPVLAEAAEAADVTVAGTDRHIPDLDEVFVRLVDRHREDRS